MGKFCAFIRCLNSTLKGQNVQDGQGIHYFKFPKDPESLQKWKTFCGLNENDKTNWRSLCSLYFPTQDIIYKGSSPSLKTGAIPRTCENVKLNGLIVKLKKQVKALRLRLKVTQQALKKQREIKVKCQTRPKKLYERKKQYYCKILCQNIKYEQMLNGVFTKKQIQKLDTKKRVNWTDVDITRGIALRSKSTRGYNYLINRLKFPFPAVSTLQRWTKKIVFRPGILHSVLNLMKEEFADRPQKDRECVLSFDEMDLDSSYCYDPDEDQVLGLKPHLQVVIIRGLLSKWKQPVFYDYNCNIKKKNLFEILTAICDAGFRVRAVVHDLGGKNRPLWTELGIAPDSLHFLFLTSDGTEHVIYMFADGPHIIKLIRNNLIDNGFFIKGKYPLSKKDLDLLVNLDCSEFRSFKLTQDMLDVVKNARQKVSTAVKTFSIGTVELMKQHYPEKTEQADFILLVYYWFSIFNSRNNTDCNSIGRGFRWENSEQPGILDRMYSEMAQLKIGNTNMRYPFVKGIMVSCRSLQNLFLDLKEDYGDEFEFLLTYKLNQDVAENFFSMVRSCGGYDDTPNAYNAKLRVRNVMLSWGADIVLTASAQADHDNVPFLTANLLKPLMTIDQPPTDIESAIFVDNDDSEVEERNVLDNDRECLINEDNWEEFVGLMSNQQQCEFGGKEYIAGFIAAKLKTKYPELVLRDDEQENRVTQSWTQRLSFGNLTHASYDMLNLCHILNEEFERFHGANIKQDKGVIKGFTKYVSCKYPEINQDVIRSYIKTRTFIRIKYLNGKLNQAKKMKDRNTQHFVRSRVVLPQEEAEHSYGMHVEAMQE